MTIINRAAYQRLIDEDIQELRKLPDTLERRHIEDVLKWSVGAIYDDPDFESKYPSVD